MCFQPEGQIDFRKSIFGANNTVNNFTFDYSIYMDSLAIQYSKPFCYLLNLYTQNDVKLLQKNKECSFLPKPITYFDKSTKESDNYLQLPIPLYSATTLCKVLHDGKLQRKSPVLSNLDKLVYAYQVACAFQHLHDNNHTNPFFTSRDVFIHCNTSNEKVQSNQHTIITNAILATISHETPKDSSTNMDYSYFYINHNKYDSFDKLAKSSHEDKKKQDIYSYGVFLIELLTEEKSNNAVAQAINKLDLENIEKINWDNKLHEIPGETRVYTMKQRHFGERITNKLPPSSVMAYLHENNKEINWDNPMVYSSASPWFKNESGFKSSPFPEFLNKLFDQSPNITFDKIAQFLKSDQVLKALNVSREDFDNRIANVPEQFICNSDALKSSLIRFPHIQIQEIIKDFVLRFYYPPVEFQNVVKRIFEGMFPFTRNILGYIFQIIFDSKLCDATEIMTLFKSKYYTNINFFKQLNSIIDKVFSDPYVFVIDKAKDYVKEILSNILIAQKNNEYVDIKPIRKHIENLVNLINSESYASACNQVPFNLTFLDKINPPTKLSIVDSTSESLTNIQNSQTSRNARAQEKTIDITGLTEKGVNQMLFRVLHSYDTELNMSITMSLKKNEEKKLDQNKINNLDSLNESLQKIGWRGVLNNSTLTFSTKRTTNSPQNDDHSSTRKRK